MPAFTDTPIEFLKGVGPQRAELLQKELGIFTFGDLLLHYPFRYVDRRKVYTIRELRADMQYIQVKGRITKIEEVGGGRARRLVATLQDDTAAMELIWFQGINYIKKTLSVGKQLIAFGKPQLFSGRFSISHPDLEADEGAGVPKNTAIQPVYNTTEGMKRAWFESKQLRALFQTLFSHPQFSVPEILPAEMLQRFGLPGRAEAFRRLHLPQSFEELDKARNRMKFEELLMQQLRMQRIRGQRIAASKGHVFGTVGKIFNTFYHHHLPFPLTNAQKRVIREIRADMATGKQMNRLLQGDVGSGKTMVALLIMLLAADNGFQSCLMAPTEILAMQHYNSLSELLKPLDVRIELLTGSTPKGQRQKMLADLESGAIHLLVGTHALIEDDVVFQNLGLVIIDEQHRFGVAQRASLWKKGSLAPHVLVMTATPIPRTLAMTVFGDLDVSIIDEMPAGRKPIVTRLFSDAQRTLVMMSVRKQIEDGRQAYFVFPLIEESEKLELKNLMAGFDMVAEYFPTPRFQMAIVHGRMKAAEKDAEMDRFKKGIAHIMVATTVIEVGVNVPNATIMVIENAERFGLSQLHQLRGRVGRGGDQSYCVLMHGNKISKEARARLEAMVQTNDGFEIAGLDLKLRGPGDLAGTRQSGLLDLRLADIVKDEALVSLARAEAQKLLEGDPLLSRPEHALLLQFLQKGNDGKIWANIS